MKFYFLGFLVKKFHAAFSVLALLLTDAFDSLEEVSHGHGEEAFDDSVHLCLLAGVFLPKGDDVGFDFLQILDALAAHEQGVEPGPVEGHFEFFADVGAGELFVDGCQHLVGWCGFEDLLDFLGGGFLGGCFGGGCLQSKAVACVGCDDLCGEGDVVIAQVGWAQFVDGI